MASLKCAREIPLLLILSALVCVSISSCDATLTSTAYTAAKNSSITLSSSTLSLCVSKTATLTYSLPSSVTESATWSSSDTTVATVDAGVVKALKAGSATITVKTLTSLRSATCALTVNAYATVSTFAGSGVSGAVNGTGTAASFNRPKGVAVDSSGYLYVVDSNNKTIRKISPAGEVTTLVAAGSFSSPQGIAVDSSGNLYVSDYSNTIYKITSAGVVTAFTGSGSSGFADGTGAAASFDAPLGLAVDASGNVYVADSGNDRIRKISPTGVVTTLAGSGSYGSVDGTGSAASFYRPTGVAVDGSGNVYVADSGSYKIRKVTPEGVVTTLAGSGSSSSYTDGTGAAAAFEGPISLTVDSSGVVYVVDSGKIRRISADGVVTTVAGSGYLYSSSDGTDSNASFYSPWGIAVAGPLVLYVSDYYTIRKVTLAE